MSGSGPRQTSNLDAISSGAAVSKQFAANTERLTTSSSPPSALRPVMDAWFYELEEDALADGASADELIRTPLAMQSRDKSYACQETSPKRAVISPPTAV
ncbi:hypothetical protein [Nocardia otitidiscaviarum]|uniref:hypothetical protein n=1 Tax=Nocardia otitidiscaviarum TaxID=1823 RepID=UPI002456127E|nr:hypothetical protein [Nocardia otitidiscaviarum]